ncbi:hypothetical protein [Methylorubrum suomiense]|uniref:Uncharacterized protein n=1 Tax=Methylorubrum suomiense TaxID=144191 RepID=A0ABQ4URR6_9HYPH|nr:hypothetical protein [Methylorubrum suomiense]GJE74865.1 hypothetical protein BGCPKDLD_1438 [Methylorubrum suomiense]
MPDNVISVLTFKSVETILDCGGTQSWVLDSNRARNCKYAVVCRNAHYPGVEGKETHGHAFMIGKVSEVVPSTETKGRWLVKFSHYAVSDFGLQWDSRNPVAYYTTDDYISTKDYKGIDFNALDFEPMPEPAQTEDAPLPKVGLTMAEAKEGLAITFGVDPAAIEITIRG